MIIKNMSHVEEEVNEYILTEKDKEKIIIIEEIKEEDKSNKKKSKKGKKVKKVSKRYKKN